MIERTADFNPSPSVPIRVTTGSRFSFSSVAFAAQVELVPDPDRRSGPYVVLLPHVASGTRETRQAMADRVVDNLRSFFATGQLVSAAPAP